MNNYDLIVIGGGPAGYSAALRGAQLGDRVGLIEKGQLGGTCVHYGCIPTKTIRSTAVLRRKIARAAEYGLRVAEPVIDYRQVSQRARSVAMTIAKDINQVLTTSKVEVITAEAQLLSGEKVKVGGRELTTAAVVIATGSRPRSLPGLEFDNKRIFSPEGFLALSQLPQSVLIIGAGVNGCEWAFILSSLGVTVTLVEAEAQILPGEDLELVRVLEKELINTGIKVLTDYQIRPADPLLSDNEKIMVAVGREALPPVNNQVQLTERGWLAVDDKLRTNLMGVYAAGDVIGPPFLAYTAQREGRLAAENALGQERRIDYEFIPRVIFSYPELAVVGYSADEAKDKGYSAGSARGYYRVLGRALAEGETNGLVKIIYDKSNYRLLGVGVIGEQASELIAEATIALTQKLTVKAWLAVLRAHPVYAEIFPLVLERIKCPSLRSGPL